MRKLFIGLLLIVFVFSNSYAVFGATVGTPIKEINVKNYGAKGDGISDDTAAIQKAIDEASAQKAVILFPASTKYYKITKHLTLRSNTMISGYGATLFMPSQSNVSVMLYSHANNYLSNVTIKGLKLSSVNDRVGTGEYEGSMTSYVEGISLSGVGGLNVQDVTMENLYMGLKLGASSSGQKNENIKVDYLNVYSSRNPLYLSTTNNFTMTNSILDATGGGTKFLHAAYFRGAVSNLYFDNVQFNNTPGGGIHIYNGKPELAAAQNLIFENCSINNTRAGVYINSGAKEITFRNLSIKDSGLGFKINGASNVNIGQVTISEAAGDRAEKGAFSLTNLNKALITDVNIDGTGMVGSIFALNDSVMDLTVSQLDVKNVKNVDFFNSQSGTIKNLVVKDSGFQWQSITNTPISFSGSGSSATFKNNQFTNNGPVYSSLASNGSGTNIMLDSNTYSGFKTLVSSNDASKINNNVAGTSGSVPVVVAPAPVKSIASEVVDASKFVVNTTSNESSVTVPTSVMMDALKRSVDELKKSGSISPPKIEIDVTDIVISSMPVNINIPVDALKALENENASLLIKGTGISFELESGFAMLVGNEVTVKFAKKSIDPYGFNSNFEPVSMVYDLDLLVNNQKVDNFIKKPIITMNLQAGTSAPEKKGAYILNTDQTWTYVMTYYDANTNTVQFKAPHFSQFTLLRYTKTFDDIQKHWAKTNIEEMASKHITIGITDNLFAPDRKITLAEFITMTLRAIDEYSPGRENLGNVESYAWYTGYLSKAKDLGLIIEDAKGKFYPLENISREQMAVISAKAHALMHETNLDDHTAVVKFKDASEINPSNLKYVGYAQDNGIVYGFNNAFMPKNEATRAEALTIIRQMLNN
jgi:hypothetical protein